MELNHTFSTQAQTWIASLATRKRKPVSPATIATYQQHINRLLPLVGADTTLASVDNGVLRRLANEIQGSPKTINETLAALKQIVASAIDQNGEQIYPRTWNHTFIDAPTVKDQKQPCATVEQINTAIRSSRSWQEQLLTVILAGTGLRISEALAIRVGPVADDLTSFLENEGVIKVRSTVYKNVEYPGKLKTVSAKRDVDLDPRLPSRIAKYIAAHKIQPGQFLFQSETGGIMNVETATRRLRNRGIPGFHSFRRFRITQLRKARIPEDLIRWWVGHSAKGITDVYDKAAEDLDYRRHWNKAAGLGFSIEYLGHWMKLRKRRSRIERLQKMLKADAEAEPYKGMDSDLPELFFAEVAPPVGRDKIWSGLSRRPA